MIVAALLVVAAHQSYKNDCFAGQSRISSCTLIIWDILFDTEQDRSKAYVSRASAYFGKGDNDRAIADDNAAIRLNPTNAAA